VVRLQARIMQVREVPAGTPVGYGHTRITKRTTRLATAAIGYADGFRRNTAPSSAAWLGETSLPMLGRVSMDSIILDATGITIAPGDLVELIGLHHDVDAVAQAAGTIGYDILTGLGHRYARHFIG
jgi:alanine racemase